MEICFAKLQVGGSASQRTTSGKWMDKMPAAQPTADQRATAGCVHELVQGYDLSIFVINSRPNGTEKDLKRITASHYCYGEMYAGI